MKIGMVIWLVLGVMFVGELMVLSDQPTDQTTNTQAEQAQNESTGPTTDQTTNTQTKSRLNSAGENNNVQPDTTKEGTSAGGGINYLNICLSLGGIGGFLYGLAAFLKFIWKARSKVDIPYSAEDIDKRDIADRLDKIQKAIEQNPKASLIEKAIADAYMLQRGERIEEAIEKWRSIANITEGNDNRLASRGLVSVGYLCVKEGMGEHALSALNKAIDLEPDFVEAYNNRGAAKNLLGRHQDAIADYDITIRLKSDYAEAYSNRGTAKNLLGRHQDAIADYDKAIRLKPDYAGAYDGRGSTKYLLGRSQDAIANYDQAIRLEPDDVHAYYHRGQANATLEKYNEAFADYNKVIYMRPNYAEVYNHRGSLQVKLGHYRKAITDYTKAIQLISSGKTKLDNNQENSISLILRRNTKFGKAEVYYNRGVAKLELGEFAEALVDLNKAIQLKPDYAEAYHNRGVVKIRFNQPNEALVDLNKAIQLKPDYAEAYNSRGGAKIQLKQFNKAITDFDKAIRINPNYAGAYSNRGGANLILGEYAEALIDLNEVIRLQPNFVLAYVNRAEAKVNLNRIDEGRSDFQTALELAEQQNNTALKTNIEKRLQELNNPTPQTDET